MLDIRDHGGIFGGVNTNKYKRWAHGTVTVSSTSLGFTNPAGGTQNFNYVTVTGLSFKPNTIVLIRKDNSDFALFSPINLPVVNVNGSSNSRIIVSSYARDTVSSVYSYTFVLKEPASVTSTGFLLPVYGGSSAQYDWYAYE